MRDTESRQHRGRQKRKKMKCMHGPGKHSSHDDVDEGRGKDVGDQGCSKVKDN